MTHEDRLSPEREQPSVTPRSTAAIEGVLVYLALAVAGLGLPNPLVSFVDDMGVYWFLGILLIHLPAGIWAVQRIVRSPRRPALLLVGFCGLMGCQHFCCLSAAARQAALGDGTHHAGQPDPAALRTALAQIDEGDLPPRTRHWLRVESDGLSGARLYRLAVCYSGSSSPFSEHLFSTEAAADGLEPIDSVGLGYFGNQTNGVLADWIIPLRVVPFARHQYWLKRDQRNDTSQLFTVAQDGAFVYRTSFLALLPWVLSLCPMLCLAGRRGRPALRFAIAWLFVAAWLACFAPWVSWGIGLPGERWRAATSPDRATRSW